MVCYQEAVSSEGTAEHVLHGFLVSGEGSIISAPTDNCWFCATPWSKKPLKRKCSLEKTVQNGNCKIEHITDKEVVVIQYSCIGVSAQTNMLYKYT